MDEKFEIYNNEFHNKNIIINNSFENLNISNIDDKDSFIKSNNILDDTNSNIIFDDIHKNNNIKRKKIKKEDLDNIPIPIFACIYCSNEKVSFNHNINEILENKYILMISAYDIKKIDLFIKNKYNSFNHEYIEYLKKFYNHQEAKIFFKNKSGNYSKNKLNNKSNNKFININIINRTIYNNYSKHEKNKNIKKKYRININRIKYNKNNNRNIPKLNDLKQQIDKKIIKKKIIKRKINKKNIIWEKKYYNIWNPIIEPILLLPNFSPKIRKSKNNCSKIVTNTNAKSIKQNKSYLNLYTYNNTKRNSKKKYINDRTNKISLIKYITRSYSKNNKSSYINLNKNKTAEKGKKLFNNQKLNPINLFNKGNILKNEKINKYYTSKISSNSKKKQNKKNNKINKSIKITRSNNPFKTINNSAKNIFFDFLETISNKKNKKLKYNISNIKNESKNKKQNKTKNFSRVYSINNIIKYKSNKNNYKFKKTKSIKSNNIQIYPK